MTNTGRAFESLTERVFKELLSQDDICTDVQRNIVLQGNSTTHQVDVYFNFIVGTVRFATIVECKDWTSPVDQGTVLGFLATLSDIPGQPRGIMVSRSGFQEGACRVASSHGINLYELREPEESDFEGRLRAIEFHTRMMRIEFRNLGFTWDIPWIREQLTQHGLAQLEFPIEQGFRPSVNRLVYESGSPCDFFEIINSHGLRGPCDWTLVHHEFGESVLIDFPPIPFKLRATSMSWEVLITDAPPEEWKTIRITPNVAYCLKDVLTGEIQYLDPNVNLTSGGGRIIAVDSE